jgi:hypothetical protein
VNRHPITRPRGPFTQFASNLRSGGPAIAVACLLGAAGCGSGDGGSGALALRVSGEAAAKTGFPVMTGDEEVAFVDGWTVTFSRYLVSLGGIELRGADGEVAFESEERVVADLHASDPLVATFEGLEARRWERFGFDVLAPDAGSVRLGDVTEGDVQRMIDGGFNYWIEGAATKDGATYTFAWGLANPTRNSSCTNGLDGTNGFVVRDNTTTEGEITIHVEHMFWDTLGSEGADLRFDAIAAVADPGGVIRLDDLAEQRLSDLVGLDGGPLLDADGQPVVYNPGSVPLPDQELRSFILAATASQGHVNGTGLCTVSVR